MLRFWRLMAVVIVTLVALSGLTWAWAHIYPATPHEVAGMPVVCIGEARPCWIAWGGTGVIVLGAGVGLVEFGIYGGGVLFGTGQITAGLIAMGQAGIGLVFWAGQVGAGLTGVGQGVLGWIAAYQGGETRDGKRFLRELSADIGDLCSFR